MGRSYDRSRYTITVKQLVDDGFNFGMKDYVCIDEEYRESLNRKIIDYYLFTEIAFETPAKFKHFLNNWLDINMSGYTEKVKMSMDYTIGDLGKVVENEVEKVIDKTQERRTRNQEDNGSSSENSTSEYVETPSKKINDSLTTIFNKFLTTGTRDIGSAINSLRSDEQENASVDNNVDREVERIIIDKLNSDDVVKFHDFINNIEKEIIEELAFLFLPFETGVDYTELIPR